MEPNMPPRKLIKIRYLTDNIKKEKTESGPKYMFNPRNNNIKYSIII